MILNKNANVIQEPSVTKQSQREQKAQGGRDAAFKTVGIIRQRVTSLSARKAAAS